MTSSELAVASFGARLGTRRVTTLAELGYDPLREDSRTVAGAGLGLRFWLSDAVTLEPELWTRGVLLDWDLDRIAAVQTARIRASPAEAEAFFIEAPCLGSGGLRTCARTRG